MKKTTLSLVAILASTLLAACSTTANKPSKYVEVAGHSFKTDPNCARKVAPTKFDEKCDEPKLGFKGDVFGTMAISAGGISGSLGGF